MRARRAAGSVVAFALACGVFVQGGSARAEPPSLLVPPSAAPDSIVESEPAPLIVPGREAPANPDTTRAQQARRFFLTGRSLESGPPGPALLAYDNALKLDPAYPEASYRMGLVFLVAGEVELAVRAFEHELEHHPGHVAAARELGLALSRLGQRDSAVSRLEALKAAHPDDDATWRALGYAYKEAGRPDDAERAYRRAIEIEPRRPGEHRDLAIVLTSLGRLDEARNELKHAIALDDSDAFSWYNLGNLERRAGRFDDALEAYRSAEARDSSFSLAVQGQVAVMLDLHRTFDAGKTYRRWLDAHPGDDNALRQAVRLFQSAGRDDIALEIARAGVAARPDAPAPHVILGEALADGGALREAMAVLRRAEGLQHDPGGIVMVRALIDSLRVAAPDSLRRVFEADSVRQANPRKRPRSSG